VTSITTQQVSDANEHERIARTLARAFQNEEACSYIFPDPEVRARRLIAMFRVIVANDAPAGNIYQSVGGEAITLWRAPGKATGSSWEFAKSLFPFIAALGSGIGRGLKISGLIARPSIRARGLVVLQFALAWRRPMLIIYLPIWRPQPSGISGFTAILALKWSPSGALRAACPSGGCCALRVD
jgi:hypothetical protein